MADKILICPRCNNYVEGKRVLSNKGKATRTVSKAVAKEISRDAVEMGTIGAGAVIGSLIFPGVGTVIGAAAGWVGKALANDAIGKKVDKAADYLEDEYTDVVYQYSCPKCGYMWVSNGSFQKNDNLVDRKRYAILELIRSVSSLKTLNEGCSLSFAGVNKSKLREKIKKELGIKIYDWEIILCFNIKELIDLIEKKK